MPTCAYIETMNKRWKSLIIDDEPLARLRLQRLLSDFTNDIEIMGEAADGDDAFLKIESLKPDLIFLDIQMPGKDVFQMLRALKHQPFVVFCTAFDHYMAESFNTYSLDYLLKPIDSERVKLTIEKLRKIENKHSEFDYQNIFNLKPKNNIPTSITHKVGNKIIPVKLEEIVYFSADDKYVNFYDQKSNKYITDLSLSALSEKLPQNFIRISRSLILNSNFVKEINRHIKGRFVFQMQDQNQNRLISGASYNQAIKEFLNI